MNKVRTLTRIQRIRGAQQQIARNIREIEERLRQVEGLPSSQPWITFKRVSSVKELRSPHRSLKEALRHDLMLLKSELKDLKSNERTAIRLNAAQASRDFKKRLQDALKKAERAGSLDDKELASLQKESLQVLKRFVGILNASPSTQNVKAVLREMEIPMFLGADIDTGDCGAAFQALANASDKIQRASENKFRGNPTQDNLKQFLDSRVLSQFLGGKDEIRREGWRSVGKTHTVVQGDTLSRISQEYYGKPGYWDIIFLENYGAIGDDPGKLRIGTELRIP